MIDKQIAKTLLCAPTTAKWDCYKTHFEDFFAGLWPQFDELISFITDFTAQSSEPPTYQEFENLLTAADDTERLDYVRAIFEDDTLPVCDTEASFAASLTALKTQLVRNDLATAMREFDSVLGGPAAHLPSVLTGLDALQTRLSQQKQRALGADADISLYIHGTRAQDEFRTHYAHIKAKRLGDETLYYQTPWAHFEPVQIKQGDLVFIGAYTSHGKSALLRFIAYYFLVHYGLNVAFWSLEMNAEVVRTYFAILHANNKGILPYTPKIRYDDYKHGRLDNEQEDFVFNHAMVDFTTNPDYGVLHIEQPNNSRFTLADLTRGIGEIETAHMPVHVLVIDYVTYMHPLSADRIMPPQPSDYNQMIKELKRACLTHRSKGRKAPLICLTAAQVSRRGYAEALKQGGAYELAAFSTYTEIERSADIAMTAFMDQQNPSQLYLQILKNRDGKIPPDRLPLHLDLEGGLGMHTMQQRNPAELYGTIRTLGI